MSYPRRGGPPVKLAYHYGTFGDLVSVSNPSSGAPYWTRQSSDASGVFARDLLGNGVTTDRIESPSHPGLLHQMRDTDAAGTDIQNLIYAFDGQRNVTGRSDQVL